MDGFTVNWHGWELQLTVICSLNIVVVFFFWFLFFLVACQLQGFDPSTCFTHSGSAHF